MRLLLIVFIFTFSLQLKAQKENIHTSFPVDLKANQRLLQESKFTFTAIALKSERNNDFSEIAFIYNSDTIFFNNELHVKENSKHFYSSLIHLDQAVAEIKLYSTTEFNDLEVILINGSGEYLDFSERKSSSNLNNDCELNGVIQQSQWRTGLPEPSYTRTFTSVGNMIVHHSAGSNNISDFTQAVRDIYILHTEENGWSDIGYNYLVAPNGVVYAGRDPGNGEQDNVMGAHFCGSNSNTMGICLLGNYETAEPETQMLESLESVLSWKAFKDDLEPMANNAHPLNTTLAVIAGHQDGCSTLCPGENIYNKLEELRMKVDEQLFICSGEENEEEEEEEGNEDDESEEEGPIVEVVVKDTIYNQTIYPNPIKSDFTFSLNLTDEQIDDIQYIRIFNQNGKSIQWQNLYLNTNKIEIELPYTLKPGIYLLQTTYKDGKENAQRFMIQ